MAAKINAVIPRRKTISRFRNRMVPDSALGPSAPGAAPCASNGGALYETMPPIGVQECSVKAQLIEDLQEAHILIASIHCKEIEAVTRGDLAGADSITASLKAARDRRDEIIRAIKERIAIHHC